MQSSTQYMLLGQCERSSNIIVHASILIPSRYTKVISLKKVDLHWTNWKCVHPTIYFLLVQEVEAVWNQQVLVMELKSTAVQRSSLLHELMHSFWSHRSRLSTPPIACWLGSGRLKRTLQIIQLRAFTILPAWNLSGVQMKPDNLSLILKCSFLFFLSGMVEGDWASLTFYMTPVF